MQLFIRCRSIRKQSLLSHYWSAISGFQNFAMLQTFYWSYKNESRYNKEAIKHKDKRGIKGTRHLLLFVIVLKGIKLKKRKGIKISTIKSSEGVQKPDLAVTGHMYTDSYCHAHIGRCSTGQFSRSSLLFYFLWIWWRKDWRLNLYSVLFTYGFTGRDKGITHVHTHAQMFSTAIEWLFWSCCVIVFDTCAHTLLIPFGFVLPILINSH